MRISIPIYANIIEASDCNDIRAVRGFLKAGTDINLKDEYGQTALMFAAREGHIEIVSLLLMNSADVDVKDNDGLKELTHFMC